MRTYMKRGGALFLTLVLLLQMFPAFAVQLTSDAYSEELYQGLTYTEESFDNTDGDNVNAFVIEVDQSEESTLTFVAGSPNDEQPLEPRQRRSTAAMYWQQSMPTFSIWEMTVQSSLAA